MHYSEDVIMTIILIILDLRNPPYRSVYLDIEGMTFTSLDELNTAIHISLLAFNEKVMAGREMSRKKISLTLFCPCYLCANDTIVSRMQ